LIFADKILTEMIMKTNYKQEEGKIFIYDDIQHT